MTDKEQEFAHFKYSQQLNWRLGFKVNKWKVSFNNSCSWHLILINEASNMVEEVCGEMHLGR